MRLYYYPLLIPLLAGLSTIIGYFLIYFPSKYQNRIIASSLSFSSGVMFTISFFSLIPEAFHFLSLYSLGNSIVIFILFFSLGLLSPYIINRFIKTESTLYRIGILSVISLMIHNIPEGILSFLTTSSNLHLGLSLSLGIAIHNIPEGIAIAVPIYYSTNSHKKAFLLTFISGFSEFLGAIFACLFLKNLLNPMLVGAVLSFTAGIMIYLSIMELLPKSLELTTFKQFILYFLIGVFVMSCCIFILAI